MLLEILYKLGFYISFKKLSPLAQVARFLGIDIDLVRMELCLLEDKLTKFIKQLIRFIRRWKASKRELESLAGVLAHCYKMGSNLLS